MLGAAEGLRDAGHSPGQLQLGWHRPLQLGRFFKASANFKVLGAVLCRRRAGVLHRRLPRGLCVPGKPGSAQAFKVGSFQGGLTMFIKAS